MNYKIINDRQLLEDFIDWLPDLETGEAFYFALFARSKYAKNEDGSNKFPHIKTDKAQLKRFTVSRKSDIIKKLEQLEIPVNAYYTKDGEGVPQEALAVYMTPNPRSQKKAMLHCMKRFCDILEAQGQGYNIHQEALSSIQKSVSRKVYFDLDFDDVSPQEHFETISKVINIDCCHFLETRGGFHLLVELDKIEAKYKKSWYKAILELGPDIKGDNMIPMVGCTQGGFTPRLLELA